MPLDPTFQQNLTQVTRGANSALVGNSGGVPISITSTTSNLDVQLWGWDSNALAPVRLSANSSGVLSGGTATYTNRSQYDASGNLIYYGLAAPGTATSAPLWQIRRLDYDGTGNLLDELYPNGSASFSNIWDNRAALSYS